MMKYKFYYKFVEYSQRKWCSSLPNRFFKKLMTPD